MYRVPRLPDWPMNTFLDRPVLDRVRAEYLEMPGMKLRIEQVQRLCGIDETTCKLHQPNRVATRGRTCRRCCVRSRTSGRRTACAISSCRHTPGTSRNGERRMMYTCISGLAACCADSRRYESLLTRSSLTS